MRPWTGIITEDEERRYAAAGFGGAGSVGRQPGLLIIDVQYRTVGTQRKPYWEAIEEYPTACGEDGWRAVDHIALLLAELPLAKLVTQGKNQDQRPSVIAASFAATGISSA